MTPLVILILFLGMLLAGLPIFSSVALAALAGIWLSGFGFESAPINFLAAISKYSLLAVPMFVLTGTILERSGVAERLLTLAAAIVGRGPGSMALITVVLAILMGGVSGSSTAIAATIGGIVSARMISAGYPRGFIAATVAAGASTDVLVPPSIVLIIYSIMVPAAPVPAMFAAGLVPGTLAGLAMLVPVYVLSRIYGLGDERSEPRPPFWKSLADASLGLIAKVIILVGLRLGLFTPTEAGAVAVVYALFIGVCVYRTVTFRMFAEMLGEAAEVVGVVLVIVGFAGVFGWIVSTIGLIDPVVAYLAHSQFDQYVVLAGITLLLVIAGMFLEGASILLIILPLLVPIAALYRWDMVWFGVIVTLLIAVGQMTPPVAINLMVASQIAGARIEQSSRWILWMLAAMGAVLLAVILFPPLALWLPTYLHLH